MEAKVIKSVARFIIRRAEQNFKKFEKAGLEVPMDACVQASFHEWYVGFVESFIMEVQDQIAHLGYIVYDRAENA